ncbi:hypothetical protein [Parasutterella excrementihominis]|uniref:hypothetical protein n=1 Tax=Parasutterella excrementihominis TaxID=487175 RepID=UPI0012BCABC6|nr:hypothetical protein [Parasutterella excrementihominis]MTT64688.1 hypothetical protein [Parasutterella excrementihominis]MTT93008.1 hypothetical protein [Parasutterella excrementihominis]
MRYIVNHPSSYLEGVSLRQRESTGVPQSENDLAVVVYLKNSNLYTTTLILDFDKAKWLRDSLNNAIKAAPLFIENKVALKTPGEF